MKKYLLFVLVFICIVTIGCGKNNNESVINDFKKQVNNLNGYQLFGKLEVVNNDDVFTYDVGVNYKDKDYYRVSLKNVSNNHEQIILRNDDGVYVMTHKSMQFF